AEKLKPLVNNASDDINTEIMLGKKNKERAKILAEARALEEEARKVASHNSVNHEKKIEELTLADAKLIKEYWAGIALKAKTEKEAGELIYREDVAAAQFALAREVREKLSSRPKMAFKMVGKDINEIEKILEKEADEIFQMLVGDNV
uniref:hypothetical protein n=1 Tax=Sulfurovum sp. TaxID=1969726 RepID=UPI00261A4A9C